MLFCKKQQWCGRPQGSISGPFLLLPQGFSFNLIILLTYLHKHEHSPSSQWQRSPSACVATSSSHQSSKFHHLQSSRSCVSRVVNGAAWFADGVMGKHSRPADEEESPSSKKACTTWSRGSLMRRPTWKNGFDLPGFNVFWLHPKPLGMGANLCYTHFFHLWGFFLLKDFILLL